MDRDALIHRIGMLIVKDPVVDAAPWDGYALIVRYDEPGGIARRLSGFRYRDDGSHDAATPAAEPLGAAIDALRAATHVDGTDPWLACVFRIRRESAKVQVEFDYDTPERWDIVPGSLDTVVERARPH